MHQKIECGSLDVCHPRLGAAGGKEDGLLSDPVLTSLWSLLLHFTAVQKMGGKFTCFSWVALIWSLSNPGEKKAALISGQI